MKKIFITVLTIIIPAFSFAGESSEGLDIGTYSIAAGYLFFVVLLIFFRLFLYFTAHPQEPEPVREYKINPISVKTLDKSVYRTLDVLFYAVAAMIILYAIIFITLLF
jgi:hypothetical protein